MNKILSSLRSSRLCVRKISRKAAKNAKEEKEKVITLRIRYNLDIIIRNI